VIRRAAILAGVSLLAACADSASPEPTRTLTLASACYRVPVARLTYFSDSGRTVAIYFANERVREAVPAYAIPPVMSNGARDFFYASMSSPTADDAERIRERESAWVADSRSLLHGLEEFSGRVVEPIDGTSLFRVRPMADSTTWIVVTRPPGADASAAIEPGFRVATCARVDGTRDRCTANVEHGSVRMTLYTTEANLALRERLAGYVIDSIAGWKVACARDSG
jgi:hypothetical protein